MDIFSALSEPTRRSIIEMLARRGQLSASEISGSFDMSAPAISQHLKVLREAKLVTVEKKAQQRLYQIDLKGMFEIRDWVGELTQLWNDRFDRLEELLKTEKTK